MTNHKNSLIQHGKKLNFLEWTTVKIYKLKRHSTAFPLSVKLVIKLEVLKFSLQTNQLIYPLMIFFVFLAGRISIDLFAYRYPYVTGDSDQFSLFDLSALTLYTFAYVHLRVNQINISTFCEKMIYPIMIYRHYHIVSWEISSWRVWRSIYHSQQ